LITEIQPLTNSTPTHQHSAHTCALTSLSLMGMLGRGVEGVPYLDEVLSVNSLALFHLSDHSTPGSAPGPSWSEWLSVAKRNRDSIKQ